MITRMERLPNEILLYIFSYLEWFDMLISFWSLNIRFNFLVCSTLSKNGGNLSNTGILIKRGLSYNKCCSKLFPLILNSLSLSSSIKRIHIDEINSIASDLCYEWLFKDKKILHFPNLKSLIITGCASIKPITQCLSYLIKHQLDELTLTFDREVFNIYAKKQKSMVSDKEKQMVMLMKFLCKLFSSQCQLTTLRLDIGKEVSGGIIHRYLGSNSYLCQQQSCCKTLRHLFIRLKYTSVLENIIQHVPNLEQMSVQFDSSLILDSLWKSNVETLKTSNENWFNKVPKLRYLSLQTYIKEDLEFIYLKWFLNNLNYIEKLRLYLKSVKLNEKIWKSFIDANFIRQYCLPDTIPNLIYFKFYICSECQLSFNDIEKIINSFKIHSFFISYQWTNVKCLFDPIESCQHLFSSFSNRIQFSNDLIKYPNVFNWLHTADFCFQLHLYPSLYLFLEQFNELSSNISSIKVYRKYCQNFNESDLLMSLRILSKMRQDQTINIPFRNITRIQFGTWRRRTDANDCEPIARNEIREKVLAHLISMCVQLKYLIVDQFEWLLHVVQYASDELRTNALSTVQYAEFCLPSCNFGSDNLIHISKNLVPFLSTYMPHLQTLRLWREDDFPWTSTQHVTVFEQDLCQLVEKLKEFVFLDIYGEIDYKKVEAYRSMVQVRFPHSRINVETSRFRLWL